MVEKKNSDAGYWLKKLMFSNSIDSTMPSVVRMAMDAAAISRPRTARSTVLRARNVAVVFDSA